MRVEVLPAQEGDYQLKDYDEMKQSFTWDKLKDAFAWNQTGKVNIAYEAIDRHAESDKKNKAALLFSDGTRRESYTFIEMKRQSNKVANVLKEIGIKKGDRVFTLMPRSPELYFSIFGILKTGAVVGTLFEAFVEDAIVTRLSVSDATALITTKSLLSKVPVDKLPSLRYVLVIGDDITEDGKYFDFKRRIDEASSEFEIEWLQLNDGMILHYTSGSTGKPKGIYHVHNAMIQIYATAKWVLDLNDRDVYWCTADPGGIT